MYVFHALLVRSATIQEPPMSLPAVFVCLALIRRCWEVYHAHYAHQARTPTLLNSNFAAYAELERMVCNQAQVQTQCVNHVPLEHILWLDRQCASAAPLEQIPLKAVQFV
jgi:hypothetical protein